MLYHDTTINVRINSRDLRLLREFAASRGTTPGALMRQLAMNATADYFIERNQTARVDD
jgi:predicted DNA binding CopG/RHH family protein